METNKHKKMFSDRENIFMKSLRKLENNLLFGLNQDNDKPNERLKTIAPSIYSSLMNIDEIYEKNKVLNHLKESHISPKITTFAIIIDVHLLA